MIKRIFLFFSFLFPMLTFAHGGGGSIHIYPVCFVRGGVYLEVNANTVTGYIGTDQVSLTRDGDELTGTIKTVQANLSISADNSVVGTIGVEKVQWILNEHGDVIYGAQPCPSVIKW